MRTYFEGLKNHDVDTIANLVAADLAFVTATRVLTKEQFLGLLRALYTGFPDWHYEYGVPEFRQEEIAVKIRQGGSHTGTFAMPGLDQILPTGKQVNIPEHYFFYKLRGDQIVEIRPDTVPGAAPRGILEQLGIKPPL